ncbi:MAG: 3-dehydroquinate synthase [Deltaproteobacteria bacterium]|nr:3-dehydroquinate synthase [Deltaproteobacteria bacterium]
MNRITVHLDKKTSSSYEIYIGQEIVDRMGLLLTKHNWAARYMIVTDSTVAALHGAGVEETLKGVGLKIGMIDFPAGEASKNIQTIQRICDQLIAKGADRTSALIALGGGVVGDIAGFVASIYMRGVPYIQVPTTLLAQVDSSIGGKTGIDLATGKNILGTFYQPKGVFIDLAFLKTLKPQELKNGLAEVVKYGIIDDPELFSTLEAQADAIKGQDADLLKEIVTRSCTIKKGIIEIDETEKGIRRILNFGHTVGHAIETESGYTIPHGDAVAIGMAAEAILSERLGYLAAKDRERIIALIRTIGFPDRIPQGLNPKGILTCMKGDKKKAGDALNIVLLKKIGVPFVTSGVPDQLIRETVEELQR